MNSGASHSQSAAPAANPPRIVIIGGGAGGLELAIELVRAAGPGGPLVSLIDRCTTHVWKPRLHEIATGLLVTADEEASFAEQAARHGFTFVLGEMRALDPAARTIDLAPVALPDRRIGEAMAELLPARTIGYDIAVLAIGSTVNNFGIAGVDEHCFTLDTAEGAQRLHAALMGFAARVSARLTDCMRVAIVGAGTTGVELAGELRNAVQSLSSYRSLLNPNQLEIVLIEMADRPLPAANLVTSNRVRRALQTQQVTMRFDAKVQQVRAGQLQLADGTVIHADLLVWASGIQGHRIVKQIPGLEVDHGGRIDVDAALRAKSANGGVLDSLYCIGDCSAAYEGNSRVPMGATAQVAEQQAHFLARSLAAKIQGKAQQAFHFHERGTLISLGGRLAVGDISIFSRSNGGFNVQGLAAKIAYVALYRAHLLALFGWRQTSLMTLSGWLRRSALPSFKLRW